MKPDPAVLDALEGRMRSVFRPDDGGDIVKWLEENVRQIPFSPMPSGFRCSETPWLAEPLRACANPEIRFVHVIAPIQSGKSLMAEMLSCFIIARNPGPTLYLNDTDGNAADWMESRLRVLWENVPPVLNRLNKGEEKRKSGTVQTNDMTFWCLGAFNEKNLQRRSIRWLVADETWLYPRGHLAEATARVTSFGWLGKRVFMSQGGYSGDETEENWVTTDRREWSFNCPKCNHEQQWDFAQVRVPESAKLYEGEYDWEVIRLKTEYECKGCFHRFPDTRSSRDDMNATGHYVRMNPGAAAHNVGFRWNALAARPWGAVAEMYLRAKLAMDLNADSSPMRIFRQKQLAEFWSDAPEAFQSELSVGEYQMGEAWQEESLIDPQTRRLHQDQTKEAHPRCRFMTVDVQRNGFFVLVRMWSEMNGSRLLTWKFVTTWEDVAAIATEHKVIPALCYVDCGDQFDDVIRHCGIYKWTALRGDQRSEFAWRITTPRGPKTVAKTYAPARLVNVGTGPVRVHHFSNLALKDQLSRLRKSGKHTVPANVGQDYIDQMESEVRVMTTTGKPEWRRIGKRHNHLWDCEVMQLVPAAAFGLMGIKKEEPAPEPPKPEESETKTPGKGLEGVGEEPPADAPSY